MVIIIIIIVIIKTRQLHSSVATRRPMIWLDIIEWKEYTGGWEYLIK